MFHKLKYILVLTCKCKREAKYCLLVFHSLIWLVIGKRLLRCFLFLWPLLPRDPAKQQQQAKSVKNSNSKEFFSTVCSFLM